MPFTRSTRQANSNNFSDKPSIDMDDGDGTRIMMMMMMNENNTFISRRIVAGGRRYLSRRHKIMMRRRIQGRKDQLLKLNLLVVVVVVEVVVVFLYVIMLTAISAEAFSFLSPSQYTSDLSLSVRRNNWISSHSVLLTPWTILSLPENLITHSSSSSPSSFSTSLHAAPIDTMMTTTVTTTTKTIITGVALSISALSGMACQKRWPSVPGILGSLVTAGCLSAALRSLSPFVPWSLTVPTVHPLYDLCFQLFLPASLTLLLLAYRQPSSVVSSPSSSMSPGMDKKKKKKKNLITTCIRRTALPFLVASIASWVGCWASYKVSTSYNWFVGGLGGTIQGGRDSIGGGPLGFSWLLPTNAVVVSSGGGRGGITSIINEEYARNAASVLTASYVGGSVNAMATSRILSTPADLLGTLVAADLITMSFYFSFLEASLDWSRDHLLSPRRWLEGQKQTPAAVKIRDERLRPSTSDDAKADKGRSDHMIVTKDAALSNDIAKQMNKPDVPLSSSPTIERKKISKSSRMATVRDRCFVSIPLLAGTYMMVTAANVVERIVMDWSGIPGTSCAVLAVVAPIINSCMQKFFGEDGENNGGRRTGVRFETITDAANPLSDFFFLTFFASMGLSVDLSTAVMSFGPSCLAFSTLALTIHVVGTILGCWPIARLTTFWNRRLHKRSRSTTDALDIDVDVDEVRGGVGLEEAWIASNAAIGGPATAAAYVMNCMKGRSDRDDELLQGRTIAATVWGVVGYAVGTVLGVAMYNWTGKSIIR